MSGAGRITLPESQYRRECRMTSKRRERTAEQAYTNGHGVAAFFAPGAGQSATGTDGQCCRHLLVLIRSSPSGYYLVLGITKSISFILELCLSVIKSKRTSVNEKARR